LRTFGAMLLHCRSYLTEAAHAGEAGHCGPRVPWQPLREIRGDCHLELADIVRYVDR
jgi:hypothetical protein